jgi:polar amino acid transport system substrate-binding protein
LPGFGHFGYSLAVLKRFLSLFAFLFLLTAAASAPADGEPAKQKLVVGTVQTAPFIVKRDGEWTGISMELWKRVAREIGAEYEVREYDRVSWRERAPKEADVFVSMNITERGEQSFDITHAFFSTGLAIATSRDAKSGLAVLAEGVASSSFLKGLAVITLILLVMGMLMWAIERKRNEEEFGGVGGLVSGFFWAVETFIGYNDPQHRTRFGRALGIFWAIVSVIALSGFTAEMSSQFTTERLSTAVSGPKDLPRVKVGTVDKSQGEKWLAAHGVQFAKYETPEALVEGLNKKEIAAAVFEAPILAYLVNGKYDSLTVLPGTFDNHGYGLGLKPDSPRREEINRALLKVSSSEEFQSVLTTWLGTP